MSYVKRSEEGFIIAEATQQDYINQMVDAYKGAADDIDLLLAKAYAKLSDATPDQYYTKMLQYERLQKLKTEIQKTYLASAKSAGRATEKGLSAAMTENYGRQLYLIDWMVPIKAMPINENVVKYAVTGNIDYWKKIQKDIVAKYGGLNLYTPQTGTLSELLSKNAAEDLDKITQSIVNGFVNGKSYAEQSRDIRTVIGDYRRKKGLEEATGATYKALRIARTEGTRVMNAGAIASGKEAQAQGVKVEKEWLATLDLKTRGRHIALDGQRVGLDDNFTDNQGATGQGPGQMSAGASNYNCRCTTMNVVNDKSPQARLAVNPETGESEIIDFTDYKSWAKANGIKTPPRGGFIPTSKAIPKKITPKPQAINTNTALSSIKDEQKRAMRELSGIESVSYSGLEPQTAASITDSLIASQTKYGPLGVDKIATRKTIAGGGIMEAALSSDNTRKLTISKSYLGGTAEEIATKIKRANDTNFYVARNVGEITTHEVGHFLQYRGRNYSSAVNLMKDIQPLGRHYGSQISRYAETHGAEMLAEAFVLVNRPYGIVTPEVRGLLDKYMGVNE